MSVKHLTDVELEVLVMPSASSCRRAASRINYALDGTIVSANRRSELDDPGRRPCLGNLRPLWVSETQNPCHARRVRAVWRRVVQGLGMVNGATAGRDGACYREAVIVFVGFECVPFRIVADRMMGQEVAEMAAWDELHAAVVSRGVLQRKPNVSRNENAVRLATIGDILVPWGRRLIVRRLVDRVIEVWPRCLGAEQLSCHDLRLLPIVRLFQPRLEPAGGIDLRRTLKAVVKLFVAKIERQVFGQLVVALEQPFVQLAHQRHILVGRDPIEPQESFAVKVQHLFLTELELSGVLLHGLWWTRKAAPTSIAPALVAVEATY
jgi:hypothetical protein